MSRIFKIVITLFLSIVAIISIVLVITLSYKNEIINGLKKYFENKINTEIRIKGIDLILIRKFPSISLNLKEVYIKSNSEFLIDKNWGDTLIFAKNIIVELSIKNLIKKEIIPTRIYLYNSLINIIIDKNNIKNYEILSKSAVGQDKNIRVKTNIIFKNSKIDYINIKENNKIIAYVDKLLLSFPEKSINNIIVKIDGFIENLDFNKNVQLNKSKLEIYANLNYKDDNIELRKTRIELNGIKFNVDGNLKDNNFNFLIESQRLDYNQFIKIFNFKKLKLINHYNNISWNFILKTKINIYKDKNNSAILKIDAICNKGLIRNTKNEQFDKVSFNANLISVLNNNNKNFKIELNKIFLEYNKNVVTGNLLYKEKNIASDLQFYIDSDEMIKFFNIDSLFTNGILEGNIKVYGCIDDLKNYKLKIIKEANINFNNFSIKNIKQKSNLFNEIEEINGNIAVFDKNLKINNLKLSILKNYLLLNGEIDFPEFSNGEIYLKSDQILINNLSGLQIKTGKSNIIKDIKIYLNINSLSYKLFKTNNLYAKINLKNDETNIIVNDLYAFEGKNSLEMKIKTFDDGNNFTGRASLYKVNIKDIFKTFNNFGQKSLTYQNIEGVLSGNILFTFNIKSNGKLDMNTLNVNSYVEIVNGRLKDYPLMFSLSKYIDLEELKDVKFKTLKNNILIEKGKIIIPEMDINSSAFRLRGSGYHTFENSYEYNLIIVLNEFLSKKARKKNPDFDNIYEEEENKGTIRIPIKIAGKDSVYNINVDKSKLLKINLSKKEKIEQTDYSAASEKNFNLKVTNDEDINKKEDKKNNIDKKSNIKFEWE